MYTLVIAFFIFSGAASGGVSSYAKDVPGFVDESTCKTEGKKAKKDLSPEHPYLEIRTSCIKVK